MIKALALASSKLTLMTSPIVAVIAGLMILLKATVGFKPGYTWTVVLGSLAALEPIIWVASFPILAVIWHPPHPPQRWSDVRFR